VSVDTCIARRSRQLAEQAGSHDRSNIRLALSFGIQFAAKLRFAPGPLIKDRMALMVGKSMPGPGLIKGAQAAIAETRFALETTNIDTWRFDHEVLRHRSRHFDRDMGQCLESAQYRAIEGRITRFAGDYGYDDSQVSGAETP
jgi:hypothetical protein